MKNNSTQSGTTQQGWIVSLAFWVCLFLASAMYAVVVLAPKWHTYQNLNSEHRNNQLQLVSLEQDVTRLGKVVSALENDTEFATELARVDFGAIRPGDESLPVDDALTLNLQSFQQHSHEPIDQEVVLPEVVRMFAENEELRLSTLVFCGVLVLLAFGFLIVPEETGPGDFSQTPLARLMNRYRKR